MILAAAESLRCLLQVLQALQRLLVCDTYWAHGVCSTTLDVTVACDVDSKPRAVLVAEFVVAAFCARTLSWISWTSEDDREPQHAQCCTIPPVISCLQVVASANGLGTHCSWTLLVDSVGRLRGGRG